MLFIPRPGDFIGTVQHQQCGSHSSLFLIRNVQKHGQKLNEYVNWGEIIYRQFPIHKSVLLQKPARKLEKT